MLNNLQDILWAKSIAVVGASATPGKMGHTILKNLIDGGFAGKLYPINPKETSLLGIPCYTSLSQVEGNIDVIVVCVPAAHVLGVIDEAGKKGVKGAIVISGGFKETGNDELEKQLVERAHKTGMRIIGPNCQGVNYTANRMCATWPCIKTQGAIGIVSQSGTIGAEMEIQAEKEGLGVTCFAALGNKSDITEVDFINFFVKDPNVKVIALNIEGIADNSGFVKAVIEAAKKKPVVVLKPGRTARGQIAVASHTKSIAGNDALFSVFCKKYGIIRANDVTEFYDCCKLAALMHRPAGNRLLIMSSSGGAGILATDTAVECGVDISPLSQTMKDRLCEVLPSQCVVSNPLDLTGDATAPRYADALRVVLEQRENLPFDAVMPIFGDPIENAYEVVAEAQKFCKVPIMVCYLGGGAVQDAEVQKMGEARIPTFPAPERAIKALGGLLHTVAE